MNARDHWDSIYLSSADEALGWTQPEPLMSLRLIGESCATGRVLDVGGGRSILAERLLDQGYSVSVLDISAAALTGARAQMGAKANRIDCIVADVTALPRLFACDVWHDRAVFHFLTAPEDRLAYKELLIRVVAVGGHVVIGTFALDGPSRCSELDVRRYDGAMLAAELGPQFTLLRSEPEVHLTPAGNRQSFQFSLFRRVPLLYAPQDKIAERILDAL